MLASNSENANLISRVRLFPADLGSLYEMLHFIQNHAQERQFEEAQILKIELACEEALVNIISYSYPEYRGEIAIDCAKLEKPGLKITIQDKGIPFNPLTNAKKYNVHALVEKRSLGGFGVFFILKLMDEVTYRRENSTNMLTLIKYL